MKLLLNMNLPRALGELLAERGHECVHVSDIGMSSSDDVEIVSHAKGAGQTILTHDLDYGELLAFSGEQYPSVIIFRLRCVSLGKLERRFHTAWPHISRLLEEGAVVTLSDQSIRVRRLPVLND